MHEKIVELIIRKKKTTAFLLAKFIIPLHVTHTCSKTLTRLKAELNSQRERRDEEIGDKTTFLTLTHTTERQQKEI